MTDLFAKKLGLAAFPDALDSIFKACQEEYAAQGTFFLKEGYLLDLQAKCCPFPRSLEHLLAAARQAHTDSDVALYALFVCRAMEQRELFLRHLKLFDFPAEHPLLALLCFAPALLRLHKELTEKGLPDDVVRDSVEMFEVCAYLQEERTGIFGMGKRYFDHMQAYLSGRMLNVGRLRFEVLRIEDIYLLPACRGRGYGSEFLSFVEASYPEAILRLEVEEENEIALHTYQKNGFDTLPYMEMKKNDGSSPTSATKP